MSSTVTQTPTFLYFVSTVKKKNDGKNIFHIHFPFVFPCFFFVCFFCMVVVMWTRRTYFK